MKRYYLILLSGLLFTAVSGFEFYDIYRVHYSTGPDPGHSGDPASGYNTCANCHADHPVRQMTSVITSSIPESGYIPNNTYTIFIDISESDLKKYGFQVSAQNEDGDFLGYFIITDENKTQLNTGNDNYINHAYNGTDFPEGKAQWSFDWVAPNEGTGKVTFYGAFVLSNNNNNPSGDIVATSTLNISESTVTHTENSLVNSNSFSLNIFPNPTSEKLQFTVRLKETTNIAVNILQPDGKVVLATTFNDLTAQKHQFSLPIDHLKHGLYHLQLISKEKKAEKRFWLK